MSQKAQSYPALKAAGRFAVNILARDQEARRGASPRPPAAPGDEKFEGVEYRPGAARPARARRTRWPELECTIVHAYPGGDHTIFVGQVEAGEWRDDAGNEPLLYFRGKYSRLHP